MTAQAYKVRHGVSQKQIAKHYFKKGGLLDLEKIESKLATIIEFSKPSSKTELDALFEQFFSSLIE